MIMKKFIIRLFIFFLLIVICDFIFGKSMNYIINHIEVGGQARDNHICNKATEDILIFGSSRAANHYNSQMIEDSIGLTCYNCGESGSGTILSYGRLLMVKENHHPRIIIKDVNPSFDVNEDDNTRYLGWLKARYERDNIPVIFDMIDPLERYKMLCKSYRYNSRFPQNVFVFLTGISFDAGIKGFKPSHVEFDTMKVKKNPKYEVFKIDTLKLKFINKFIEESKDCKLYFVVSPIWYGMDTIKTTPIRDICIKSNIPFLDYSNDPKYVHNNYYFRDGTHLNARGANEFTKDLIMELRKRKVFE